MNHTPRRTHLHLLALCLLIAPAALARNFGPPAGQEKTGEEKPSQAAPQNSSGAAAPASTASSATAAAPAQIVVPAGTRLPLVLHNSITTRNAMPGDPLYLETTYPILVNDRIVIPAGTFVQGEITEAKRAAKGKGGAEVRVRLTSLVLPMAIPLNSTLFLPTPEPAAANIPTRIKRARSRMTETKPPTLARCSKPRAWAPASGPSPKAWKERASARPWAPRWGSPLFSPCAARTPNFRAAALWTSCSTGPFTWTRPELISPIPATLRSFPARRAASL